MNEQIAKTILDFMARVDLKGAEVPVFMECISELNKFLDKKEMPETAGGSVPKSKS